jgi:hypothetical protein
MVTVADAASSAQRGLERGGMFAALRAHPCPSLAASRKKMPNLRTLSPATAGAAIRVFSAGLLLVLATACQSTDDGGDGTIDLGTGPGDFPKVQGYFQRSESVGAVTCTSPNPPAGGDIAMGAYTLSEPVGFTQSGSKVSIVLLNYPGDPPDTGTVDMTGKVTLGFKLSIKEQNLRAGRQFYVDITGSFVLNRSADGNLMTGTGSYENVLREGSATATPSATCTRTSTIQMTRTGG